MENLEGSIFAWLFGLSFVRHHTFDILRLLWPLKMLKLSVGPSVGRSVLTVSVMYWTGLDLTGTMVDLPDTMVDLPTPW